MRPNYAVQIRALGDDELEEFVHDWLAQRKKDYHGHELWRGSGDMGRDVTGYVTDQRLEGPWDNFQCKQLIRTLSLPAVLVELGKIIMHSANGEFDLPRAYVFVAPRGVQRAVQALLAHPERMRQKFLDQWDTAYSDEAGQRFRSITGHPFRFHSGRDSDLKPAIFGHHLGRC